MIEPIAESMGNDSLAMFHWRDTDPVLAADVAKRPEVRPLARGREAELLTLGTPARTVVKIWMPGRGDAGSQFRLLRALAPILPAPAARGWAVDRAGRQALAMAYTGSPLVRAGVVEIDRLAASLVAIHAASYRGRLPADHSPAELIARLLPGDQPDLVQIARALVPDFPEFEPALTHGDFHVGNITCEGDRLCVVDWSDARLTDWRYDLGWALLLLAVYQPHGQEDAFLHAYTRQSARTLVGLNAFAALAALHWIYLVRTAPVPINREWLERAHSFLTVHLPAGLCPELPKPLVPPRPR